MENREEAMRNENKGKAQTAVSDLSAASRTVDIEPCGMLCAIMRPLRDSGMVPGTDRYVELEQQNATIKKTLRDA
jgi:hypothetical protein